MPIAGPVWPAVAEALSAGPEITDTGVAEALREAEPYLTLDEERGTCGLARPDILVHVSPPGAPADRREGHRRIMTALLALGTRRGWAGAEPYLLRHLPVHYRGRAERPAAAHGVAASRDLLREAALRHSGTDYGRSAELDSTWTCRRRRRTPSVAAMAGRSHAVLPEPATGPTCPHWRRWRWPTGGRCWRPATRKA
ncbi:hypothetical protein [Actinomadura sp. HBU206391]|uniref:hypothetical protein n=1 Tax=Actinomadura sp. HBU206391 TaxID=2731692 RepID=UPI00164F028B|nr:hypothetical protein [Actinomadura sp. HBU206391]MBC6460759.1 hypothetical protein [Actinomadura sp. HBU206391]